jgi:methionyl-tRNA formyltransferase
MTKKLKIVFFGSGPVAAASLTLLLPHFTIEAVVTKPKPAHHRGVFPVIAVAETYKLPIITVKNKQELSTVIHNGPFISALAILIDFGIIVGQDIIDYFPKGIVNSHFSLLPEWRGADPITFAILSGQPTTGVSLMLLTEAMDEGPILAQESYNISRTETTSSLTEALIPLSVGLLQRTMPLWVENKITPLTQMDLAAKNQRAVTYSRKLTKLDGKLDFSLDAVVLERQIRAYSEWPKSTTLLANIEVIITSVEVTNDSGKPGDYHLVNNDLLLFCKTGALSVKALKPAGKQLMAVSAFLAGYRGRLV